MCAEVRVDATTMERLKVKNGLRQGCTLAPTLFSIYFSAMVANLCDECMGAGVCCCTSMVKGWLMITCLKAD